MSSTVESSAKAKSDVVNILLVPKERKKPQITENI